MDSPFDSYFQDAIRDEDLQRIFWMDSRLEAPHDLPDSEVDLIADYSNPVSLSDETPQTYQAELLSKLDAMIDEPQGRLEMRGSRSAMRPRFTETQSNVLESWINAHSAKAYPVPSEMATLVKRTGLTRRQVSSWFVRRRQHLCRTSCHPMNDASEAEVAHDSRDADGDAAMSSLQVSPPSSEKTPSDNGTSWPLPCDSTLSSPEERDPSVPSFAQYRGTLLEFYLDTISNEIVVEKPDLSEVLEGVQDVVALSKSAKQKQTDKFEDIIDTHALSGIGLAFAGSRSAASGSTSSVASSVASSSVASSRGRRQGRALFERERSLSRHASLSPQVDGAHRCRICEQTFTRRASLKRHQDTVHASSAGWKCEGLVKYDVHGRRFDACPVCGRNANDPRQCPHRMSQCWTRDIALRTFNRRDCLVQHWKGKTHSGFQVL